MPSIESLRNRVQHDAVQPARPASERVRKLAEECARLEQAARSVLDGSGGSVGSVVPSQLSKAYEALMKAKRNLVEAGKRAELYVRSLP